MKKAGIFYGGYRVGMLVEDGTIVVEKGVEGVKELQMFAERVRKDGLEVLTGGTLPVGNFSDFTRIRKGDEYFGIEVFHALWKEGFELTPFVKVIVG